MIIRYQKTQPHCSFAELSYGIIDDFWVYGTDAGCPGKWHWCSTHREFEPKELFWQAGEPSGLNNCVFFRNKEPNETSTLGTADCNKEMRFFCDVRQEGPVGLTHQQECTETWDVTEGIIMNINENRFKFQST